MKESLSAELEAINRESQFQKGEIRRAEKRMKEEIAARDAVQAESDARIDALKEKRKEMSGRLQQKIFGHFSFLNAYGERKGLLEIFGDSTPPAGTGECAAPRLLQYA
jgi:tRNA pseudouridine32 synthase/23S rRNA pseudouridine746 synthase